MRERSSSRPSVLFSKEARALYRRLIDGRVSPVVEDSMGEVLQELVGLGLAHVADGRVIGVSPTQGQLNLVAVLHMRTREMLDQLAEASDFVGGCARSETTASSMSNTVGAESVRVITDPGDVLHLSSEIPAMARRSYCSVQTHSRLHAGNVYLMVGPAAKLSSAGGVRSRVIVDSQVVRDRQANALFAAGTIKGEHVRCHPAPPLKFMLVDNVLAMLPLDESGAAGAVVLESTAIGAMLAWTFERLWEEAEPFSLARPGPADLDPVHIRILRLLAEDASDPAIAVALGVSDRSLRRHISTLIDRLGVGTRHGAIAAAYRRGLLP